MAQLESQWAKQAQLGLSEEGQDDSLREVRIRRRGNGFSPRFCKSPSPPPNVGMFHNGVLFMSAGAFKLELWVSLGARRYAKKALNPIRLALRTRLNSTQLSAAASLR